MRLIGLHLGFTTIYNILVENKPLDWGEQNITDPTVAMFIVQEPSLRELWEFRIFAAIDEGVGPFRGIEQSFFAPPVTKP